MDEKMIELIEQIAHETDFVNYESNRMGVNKQMVFYGHSSEYDRFKHLAADNFLTGTMVILVDTLESHVYSHRHREWY